MFYFICLKYLIIISVYSHLNLISRCFYGEINFQYARFIVCCLLSSKKLNLKN